MHEEAKKFLLFVKSILPEYFENKIILDVGSGDINGNNRFLFNNCTYHGNDVIEGKNVTIVSKTKDLLFENNYFDTIISTECFEHDPEYEQSLLKIYDMLKDGGLFFFTCASTNRPEHGTRRTSPEASLGTFGNIPEMIDYYKNLTIKDINKILNLNKSFSSWNSYFNGKSHDLYFVGIKKGDKIVLKKYNNRYIINTTNRLY